MTDCTCFDDERPLETASHWGTRIHARTCWHVPSGTYTVEVGTLRDGRTSIWLEEDGDHIFNSPEHGPLHRAVAFVNAGFPDHPRLIPDDLREAIARRPLDVPGTPLPAGDPQDLAHTLFA